MAGIDCPDAPREVRAAFDDITVTRRIDEAGRVEVGQALHRRGPSQPARQPAGTMNHDQASLSSPLLGPAPGVRSRGRGERER